MFGRAGVLIVPLILIVAVVVSRSLRPRERVPSRVDAMMASHRKAVSWRWAGLGLGVAAAALTANAVSLGLGVLLAPAVFGPCVIAGVIAGELTTVPRRQGIRTAALQTRSIRHYLPRLLGGLVAGATGCLGALLVTTTMMGSADDLGRAGRSLSLVCSPLESASHSPWPGLFYSVPLGIAVIVGLVLAAMALRTVVLRPRSGSDPDLIAGDDVLRRRSAEAVVAATGVMVATSTIGVALTAAGGLLGIPCAPTSWTAFGVALLVLAALMLLLGVWCLALLLAGPGTRGVTSHEDAASGPGAYL